MRKLFQKGKELLQKFEDKQNKQNTQTQGETLVSSNKIPQNEEKKAQQILKKILNHEKLNTLQIKILKQYNQQQQQLIDEEKKCNSLQNSLYYKPDSTPFTPCLRQYFAGKKVDFSNQDVQTIIKQKIQSTSQFQIFSHKNPLFLIAIIGFHHKKGSQVQYVYPEQAKICAKLHNEESQFQFISDQLLHYAMPDAVHNKNEDCIFFTLKVVLKTNVDQDQNNQQQSISQQQLIPALLFGVSYFKQIAVTQKMREQDPELTRNHIQKSLCLLSLLPLYGYLMNRLYPTISAYFAQDDFQDFNILSSAYENIDHMLKDTVNNIQTSELFNGVSPKTAIYTFKEKTLQIIKAILLEKKILVFSLHSQACSNFILSLLSLIPGSLHFRMNTRSININEMYLRDYGMPFRLFNDCQDCQQNISQNSEEQKSQKLDGQGERLLALYFTLQNLDKLKEYKSYLIGTTNQLIRIYKEANPDIIVDLDKNQLEINESIDKQLHISSFEKQFIENLFKTVKSNIQDNEKDWKNQQIFTSETQWLGSNDYIRQQFQNYFCDLLADYQLFEHELINIYEEIKGIITTNEKFFTQDDNKDEAIASEIRKVKPQLNSAATMDGEGLMVLGITTQETKREKFFRMKKEILFEYYKSLLKKYNFKFILSWLYTDNHEFWKNNHDTQIYQLSNSSKQNHDRIIFINDSGDIYVGGLHNGKKEGPALVYDLSNEKIVNSTFKNGLIQGNGTVRNLDNTYFFEGSFIDGLKHGQGQLINKKMKYSGNFKQDKFSGFGILIDEENNIYDGEFCNNMMHGTGKLQIKNGDIYIGQFKNGLFDGQGQYLSKSSGIVFSGTFRKGKRCGYGEMQNPNNNEKYQGEWNEDVYHGQGVYTNQDGVVFQGLFSNGQLVQNMQNIIKYTNGDVYSGFIVNFLAEGKGILAKKDQVIVGEFQKGECVNIEKIEIVGQQQIIQKQQQEKDEQQLDQLIQESQELELENQKSEQAIIQQEQKIIASENFISQIKQQNIQQQQMDELKNNDIQLESQNVTLVTNQIDQISNNDYQQF